MNKPGLVSISFRNNTVDEIISACTASGIAAIEWGSDIHIPHGDTVIAEKTAKKCASAGITCPSYGSYYRLGVSSEEEFLLYVLSAKALGASVIRIWGGENSSRDISMDKYNAMVKQTQSIFSIAMREELSVALECHNFTVTDTYSSALKFINDVQCQNLKMYWQPNQYCDLEYNSKSASALSKYISNIHVFNWSGDKRLPLGDSIDIWKQYIEAIGCRDSYCMLEFMPDDDIKSLSKESQALFNII